MPTNPPDVVLESLRGGYVDSDPPNALQMDECAIAENVEWFLSTLGERRLGSTAFSIVGSGISSDGVVVFAVRHFPTKDEIDNELWVFSAIVGTSVTISRWAGGVWTTVMPLDAVDADASAIYQVQGISFDEKLYLCFKSGVDRLHVWDGTTLRRVGLAMPSAAPAVVDEGSGTFAIIRYYRMRYVVKSGAVTLIRSEPSDSTAFTPSGSGAGATITKPPAINEGETDWEVEASYDNTLFYRIATVPVATTTYDDETPQTVTYRSLGPLSETIGEYVPPGSARYVGVDDDRIVLGGSFEDLTFDSRALWTPSRNDPGVGNAERIPANTNNFRDLDPKKGGGLVGISQSANGVWYAFKAMHIYSLTRTRTAANAYSVITITEARGAIFGSIVSGVDEYGRGCIYFTDSKVGPYRLGPGGLQQILGLRKTWGRLNGAATQAVVRSVYYPFKQQVWWFLAVDGANAPNLGIKLQVNELRDAPGGAVSRGWAIVNSLLATALTATLFAEQAVDVNGNTILSTRPILGMLGPNYLLRSDTGDDDNGTPFFARMRTRPLFQTGLLNRWGAMTAALLAVANGDANVQVSFIRDYGLERNHIVTPLTPQADEAYVVKAFDNLVMSSALGVQIEFSDVVDPAQVPGVLYHTEP